MESATAVVRIVVLGPNTGVTNSDDTLRALQRLGDEASIERCPRIDLLPQESEAELYDLFVLDCIDENEAARWLGIVGKMGPPVLAVLRSDDDEAAMRAFRNGAAECVRVGADFANVLPAEALDLIHRWQGHRERGLVEQRIRWLEGLHEAIISQIPAGLVVLDGDGCVVTLNPECTRLLSVSEASALGKPFASICPVPLYKQGGLAKMLEGARHGDGVPATRVRFAVSGDNIQVFDVRVEALDSQGRVLLVLSDVTEIEQQAERIGELQRYNANIVQNINSALVVVEPNRIVSFANRTAEQILGVGSGKLVGRRIADWFRDNETGVHLIVQTLMDGECFKGAETMIVRDDGRVIPIGISCSPLEVVEGMPLGAVAIFQDLTDIKQLERQALQSEKLASIGQLAAGVAHEINNPVGFIHANLFQVSEYLQDLGGVWQGMQALQDAVASGAGMDEIRAASSSLSAVCEQVDLEYVKNDIVKAVSESQEGSERIRHIVRDLRDFSRQDTGEATLADVNQCVESTVNIVWTMMKHVVVLKKDYAELPRLRCYPMQLKQVVMNLLVNACQAIEEKQAQPGAATEPGQVEVRTLQRDGGIAITIRDTGAGIAPDALAKIFDPFFTTKDVGAGTGLGLSTSYSIVQRHGGAIKVMSEVGQGTMFDVWLPERLDPTPRAVVKG
jgi:PAS domain S-box-containing protein